MIAENSPRYIHKEDIALLKKMIAYCGQIEKAVSLTGSKENLARKPLYRMACAAAIEHMGELSKKIHPATRKEYREIPWLEIRQTRNRYAHELENISLNKMWTTITRDIPKYKKIFTACLEREKILLNKQEKKQQKTAKPEKTAIKKGRRYLPKKKESKNKGKSR